jgi:mono/diheme cytochrome c family protein
MKRTIAVAAGFVAIAALGIAPAQAAEEAPTFNGEVGQILLDNCASCHRPNQVAPMSLLSYRDARPWARAIKSKVVSREMPPWFADPRFGTFSNDISLSDDEIGTIVAWVDGGAPQGDGPAPAPPDFSAAGWSHPDGLDPDYVIEFPIAWRIDAEGETPNFNLFTPLPFDDVMRVSATEVRPGNYAVTHHITTGLVDLPPGTKLGRGPAWPGGPLVDYVPVEDPDAAPVEDEAEEDEAEVEERSAEELEERRRARGGFGPYIPGVGARVVRDGQIREVRGDLFDYIIWNLHYQATGKPEVARPSIGAWFAKDTDGKYQRTLSLREYTSENKQLVAPPPLTAEEREAANVDRQAGQGLNPLLAPIPPNDPNWTVTGIGAFQNDAVLQSLFLHMHVRGRDVTYVLTYPDGREEILLRVPNYAFDWQFEYDLVEPIRVPAGSTVKAIARYDNSRANRLNPAPHKEVYWSEQSWDDMFLANVKYTLEDEDTEGDN